MAEPLSRALRRQSTTAFMGSPSVPIFGTPISLSVLFWKYWKSSKTKYRNRLNDIELNAILVNSAWYIWLSSPVVPAYGLLLNKTSGAGLWRLFQWLFRVWFLSATAFRRHVPCGPYILLRAFTDGFTGIQKRMRVYRKRYENVTFRF